MNMTNQASTVLPLAQSDSKVRFMQRLDLDINIADHRRIYTMMKAEAARSRESMMRDRNALVSQLKHDQSVQPPFSSSQMSETAMHREMLRIYENASPETRPFYDRAHDVSGAEAENWIIRWMLWHVFRYRDSRNKSKPARTEIDDPTRGTAVVITGISAPPAITTALLGQASRTSEPTAPLPTAIQSAPWPRTLPFDPARDI